MQFYFYNILIAIKKLNTLAHHLTLTRFSAATYLTVTIKQTPNYLNYSTMFTNTKLYTTTLSGYNNSLDVISLLNDLFSKKNFLLKSIISYNTSTSRSELVFKVLYICKNTSNLFTYKPFTTLSRVHFFKPQASECLKLKSTYKPLRKGLINMIRIHSDKAVAFPTDTRVQILAVSKDIIHS